MGNVVRFRDSGKPPSLETLTESFLDDLAAENRSVNTVKGYRADIFAFLTFYGGSVGDLTTDILRAYFRTFQDRQPSTQARHRASLKAFLGWLVRQDVIQANPLEKLGTVRVPERQPRPVPDQDVTRLLKAIRDPRDRLLFTLISETGLRISEALGIRVNDIRLEAQEITVRGKGNRERTVYLVNTESLRLLRRFLKEVGLKDGYVFRPNERKQRCGRTGLPLHYTTVNEKWRKMCKEAGVEATIHQLRHTYATRLINQGKDIQVVSKVLGHKRIATTQLYAQLSDEAVKRELSD